MHTRGRHTEKKTLSKAESAWEAEKFSLFWRAGGLTPLKSFPPLLQSWSVGRKLGCSMTSPELTEVVHQQRTRWWEAKGLLSQVRRLRKKPAVLEILHLYYLAMAPIHDCLSGSLSSSSRLSRTEKMSHLSFWTWFILRNMLISVHLHFPANVMVLRQDRQT